MDLKNSGLPFSLYDFFGYLFPGGIFWVLLLFSSEISQAIKFTFGGVPLKEDIGALYFRFVTAFEASAVIGLLLLLVISYITGHLVASLSSYFFERILVERWLGYPATTLFQLSKKRGLSDEIPKCVFKKVFRFIFRALFGKFTRPYSQDFIESYKRKFETHFEIAPTNPSDVFWLSFEYIAQNSSTTLSRCLHFLNLYGFSRNLSMVFFLVFVFDLVRCSPVEALVYLVLSLFLFVNYLKLLRRANDEVFRGFYVKTMEVENGDIE